MNREDIIKMARECHLIGMRPHLDGIYEESLERFASLAYAAGAAAAKAEEREACAKVCEELHPGLATRRAAEIIRARGETK